MDINKIVTELQNKQVDVLYEPNYNFAIVFYCKKYIIDINANCMICIRHITNNYKNAVKQNADCKYEVFTSDSFGGDAPLFVNGVMNPTYFANTEIVKTFDISQLRGTSVGEQFAELGDFKYADDLRSMLTKILEAYNKHS